MVYIVIPENTKREYILGRLSSLGWDFFDASSYILVHNNVVNSKSTLEQMSAGETLANTVVFKLEDNESFFYWGYASQVIWDWLRDHSQNPHTTWTA